MNNINRYHNQRISGISNYVEEVEIIWTMEQVVYAAARREIRRFINKVNSEMNLEKNTSLVEILDSTIIG